MDELYTIIFEWTAWHARQLPLIEGKIDIRRENAFLV
jgi:hypothetical protein